MATSNSFTSGFEQSEQIMIQKKGKTLSGACAEGVRIGIEKIFSYQNWFPRSCKSSNW